MLSAMVFETRGGDGPTRCMPSNCRPRRCAGRSLRPGGCPTNYAPTRTATRLNPSREPDEGFAPAVYRWATTGNLAAALAASDVAGNGVQLPAGDFVRWCRQVLDLLDQVRNAAPEAGLRKTAKRAIDDIRRGVVAVDNG